ncbi:metal ABC transporter ATP-binding protein [Texcoconibacillus texcoconensis]|uniref:Zinc transport system ATP-binding protein n=1 Tax=Texcoconibacillus texcoconensis TaxID=1095777 RepID=A0A840QRC8_9BACI|nr:metal ABC transporter ATP-binding protein [Texcoconibacillus texcoconensis]MBB5173909.1 zinc transport system ATP-binding protein [Texcoconibacillus texcoconensis]
MGHRHQLTDSVIQVNHLSFKYTSQYVLEDITLHVRKGAFLGLVGPNGSGKSTLVKCLLGIQTPQQGDISLFGEPLKKFSGWDRIGYVSQKANSFNSGFPATVFEVVSMGLYGKIGLFRFLTKKHKQKVYEAIEKVEMSAYTNENIGNLSGGQQQRVFIARALVSDPDLLILDEPTVGVDVHSVQQFYTMLKQLNQEHGITLVLITHDIGAMTDYVTDVACLNKHLHFHGDTDTFTESENEMMSTLYGHDVHMLTHNHDHSACEVPTS